MIDRETYAASKVYTDNAVQGGGGGGSSTLSGLTDVNLTSPTNGQSLVYNASSGKWVNATGGSGGMTFEDKFNVAFSYLSSICSLASTTINITLNQGRLDQDWIVIQFLEPDENNKLTINTHTYFEMVESHYSQHPSERIHMIFMATREIDSIEVIVTAEDNENEYFWGYFFEGISYFPSDSFSEIIYLDLAGEEISGSIIGTEQNKLNFAPLGMVMRGFIKPIWVADILPNAQYPIAVVSFVEDE